MNGTYTSVPSGRSSSRRARGASSLAAALLAIVLASSTILSGLASANPPLPPLPDPHAPPPPPSAPPAPPSPPGSMASGGSGASALLLERARRGVVTVEQGARVLGLGTVLSGDGRIVTALSLLGTADQVDVRYIDGTVVHTRVGHKDKAWDLALLVPLSGRWTEGLAASPSDPGAGGLTVFVARAAHPAPVPAAFKARLAARSRDAEPLEGAVDVDLKGVPTTLGAPVVDVNGGAVGILVQLCRAAEAVAPNAPPPNAPPKPCVPITLAAPVSALRHFLVSTPASAAIPTPWLGIRGESEHAGSVHGVRVVAVATGSPADKGGLKANLDRALSDMIVAVDAQPVETPEKLSEVIAKHAVGDTVKLLVFAGDRFRDVSVVLKSAQ